MSERETIAEALGALSANVAALTRELRLMREGRGDAAEAADPVAQWIADRCRTQLREGETRIAERTIELYADFLDWAGVDEDDPPMTLTAFGRRLTALGYPVKKGGGDGLKRRMGLRLLAGARLVHS